jgi:hypothetical protein
VAAARAGDRAPRLATTSFRKLNCQARSGPCRAQPAAHVAKGTRGSAGVGTGRRRCAEWRVALGRAQAAEGRELELARELRDTREQLETSQQGPPDTQDQRAAETEQRIHEIETQLVAAQREATERFEEVEIVRGELVPEPVAVEHGQELAVLDADRRADLTALQDEVRNAVAERDQAKKEVSGVKTVALAMAVFAVAVAAAVAMLTGGSDDTQGATPCKNATDWVDASRAEGSRTTIRGPIVSGTYRKLAKGQPTYLDMGAAYPDRSRVSILIWGDVRSKFPGRPESIYDGRHVAVTGAIRTYRGTLQIVVNTPSAITTCS